MRLKDKRSIVEFRQMEVPKPLVYENFGIPDPSQLREMMQKCYLCGTGAEELTSDESLQVEHVIPKVVFAPYNPQRYVKLAACRKCNKDKGFHDEYVTRYLQATSFVPSAYDGIKEAIRGFQNASGRGANVGLLNDLRARTTSLEMRSEGGFYLGNSPGLLLDIDRFKIYCSNIAKGLFVRNSLQFYDWDLYEIDVFFDQVAQNREMFDDEHYRDFRSRTRFMERWGRTFYYRGDFDKGASMWQMVLYSSYIVTVTMIPKAILLQGSQESDKPS